MTARALPHRAFIGLGSNLEDPVRQLEDALAALAGLPVCRLVQCSPFYNSKPVGPQDQDDFVNAVVLLETAYTPLALLDQLQRLEQRQRRVRVRHWGPRTLDLDLLLYDALSVDSQRLILPHKEMLERVFVWAPLLDIAPDIRMPDGSSLAQRVNGTRRNELTLLGQPST